MTDLTSIPLNKLVASEDNVRRTADADRLKVRFLPRSPNLFNDLTAQAHFGEIDLCPEDADPVLVFSTTLGYQFRATDF